MPFVGRLTFCRGIVNFADVTQILDPMAVSREIVHPDLEPGFLAAKEQKALAAGMLPVLARALSEFNREDVRPAPVADLDRFLSAVRSVSPQGAPSWSGLLDGDCTDRERGAAAYLHSMLAHILETNPDVTDEPWTVLEALGAECVFDCRSRSFFVTEYSSFVLDKDAGLLDCFNKDGSYSYSVGPWDAKCEKRPRSLDPVFDRFLEGRYEAVRLNWNRFVMGPVASAGEDKPVRVSWSDEKDLKMACIRRIALFPRLKYEFAGGFGSGQVAYMAVSNVLNAIWDEKGRLDPLFAAVEHGEEGRLIDSVYDRFREKDYHPTLELRPEDVRLLHECVGDALGVYDYCHYDVLQKVRWRDRDYLLPGYESMEVVDAKEVNGHPRFLAFERGGLYGNRVYDADGRAVLRFGPYGPPALMTVDGFGMFVQHEDSMTGVGTSTPVVFYDEDGRALFKALQGTPVEVKKDPESGLDVIEFCDLNGDEHRFGKVALLAYIVSQAPERSSGEVVTLAAGYGMPEMVYPARYSPDVVVFREGVLDVLRESSRIAEQKDGLVYMSLDIPNMRAAGAVGLVFTGSENRDVSVLFKDGSALDAGRLSTLDLKLVRLALDTEIKRRLGKVRPKGLRM